jgi:hypothetical protein
MKTAEEYVVKMKFLAFDHDGKPQQKVITLRTENKSALTFLQIASLKLQAPILETIPVIRECDHQHLLPELGEVIEAAVAEERERCAKIAESPGCLCKAEELHDGCCGACGSRIAGVIRERRVTGGKGVL